MTRSRQPPVVLVIGPPSTFGPTIPSVIVVPLTTTHRSLSFRFEVEPTEPTLHRTLLDH